MIVTIPIIKAQSPKATLIVSSGERPCGSIAVEKDIMIRLLRNLNLKLEDIFFVTEMALYYPLTCIV